jgi:hypothetical protein
MAGGRDIRRFHQQPDVNQIERFEKGVFQAGLKVEPFGSICSPPQRNL